MSNSDAEIAKYDRICRLRGLTRSDLMCEMFAQWRDPHDVPEKG